MVALMTTDYILRQKIYNFKNKRKAHKVKITEKDKMLSVFDKVYEKLKKIKKQDVPQSEFNDYLKALDERKSFGELIINKKPNLESLKEAKKTLDNSPYIALYTMFSKLGCAAYIFFSQLLFAYVNKNYNGYIEIRPYIWSDLIGLTPNTIKKYVKMCVDLEILIPAIAYCYYNEKQELCTIKDYVLDYDRLRDVLSEALAAKQKFTSLYNKRLIGILEKSTIKEDKEILENLKESEKRKYERKEYIKKAIEFYEKNKDNVSTENEALKEEEIRDDIINQQANEIERLKAEIEALKANTTKPKEIPTNEVEVKIKEVEVSKIDMETPKMETKVKSETPNENVEMETKSKVSTLQKGEQASIFDFGIE